MNAAVGVRTPAAILAKPVQGEAHGNLLVRFERALKETRRREARRVIATHAHLLPPDHPCRNGPYRGNHDCELSGDQVTEVPVVVGPVTAHSD
jgi:hypothetical protein